MITKMIQKQNIGEREKKCRRREDFHPFLQAETHPA